MRRHAAIMGAGGASAAPWLPNTVDLPTLYGWYDFSLASTIYKDDGVNLAANGEDIYRVNSRVGDRPIKQTSATYRPTRRTAVQNGLSVAEFVTDYLSYTGAANGFNNFTGIVVCKVLASTGDDYLYWCGNTDLGGAGRAIGHVESVSATKVVNNGYAVYVASTQDYDIGSAYHLVGNTYTYSSNALKFFYDGTQANLTLNGNTAAASGTVGIGAYSASFHYANMYCCEAIFCTSVLADADIRKLEGYLAWKWGLQGNLPVGHPYKSAAP